nr:hypothetical protein [Pandoravirus aubagnensis]
MTMSVWFFIFCLGSSSIKKNTSSSQSATFFEFVVVIFWLNTPDNRDDRDSDINSDEKKKKIFFLCLCCARTRADRTTKEQRGAKSTEKIRGSCYMYRLRSTSSKKKPLLPCPIRTKNWARKTMPLVLSQYPCLAVKESTKKGITCVTVIFPLSTQYDMAR